MRTDTAGEVVEVEEAEEVMEAAAAAMEVDTTAVEMEGVTVAVMEDNDERRKRSILHCQHIL